VLLLFYFVKKQSLQKSEAFETKILFKTKNVNKNTLLIFVKHFLSGIFCQVFVSNLFCQAFFVKFQFSSVFLFQFLSGLLYIKLRLKQKKLETKKDSLFSLSFLKQKMETKKASLFLSNIFCKGQC